MKQLLLVSLLVTSLLVSGQKTIYSYAFGKKEDKPIIFIHGGPSGNSTLFEFTTAKKLAENGFYVIVYDRRGEGRSIDSNAKFTYQECFDDLNYLYNFYNIKKAVIIGHSFGGLVGTLFSEKYPQKVQSLILAGALVSQQKTYDNILKNVEELYKIKNDTFKLKEVTELRNRDRNSAEYREKCFDLAYENLFFEMPKPTKKSIELRLGYQNDVLDNNIRNQNAPLLFYKNETLKNIDTKAKLVKLKKQFKVYAIYGKDDRIFGESQLNKIRKIVGEKQFVLIDNCSHYLFVDQQEIFITSIVDWLNK